MDYFDKARDLYNSAVKAVSKTETEKKLAEAMSNENWGASTTLMREIANLTNDWSEYSVVMREVFGVMGYQPRCWRQIFKALTLLEYLLKNGAEKCIQEARDRMHMIRSLSGFSYFHDGGEKGAGVREKAKQVVALLSDNDFLMDEREKARQLRDKYTGIGKDGVIRGGGGASVYDNGQSSHFGDSGGRYNDEPAFDDFSKPKKKDKKKKDKKKVVRDDSDDDFDFDDKPKKKSTSKDDDDDFGKFESDDDDFGNFDEEEEEEVKPKKKDKKSKKDKKGKSKKKTIKNEEEDDDLFGDFEGGGQNDTFDPFNSGSSPQNGNTEWANFESAPAPTRQAQSSSNDFGDFGDFSSGGAPSKAQSPQNSSDPFDVLGGSNTGGGNVDFFGNSAPQVQQSKPPQQPMMMNQQQPMMMMNQQQPMMMQQQQPMMMQQQPMMMQQQQQQQQPMMMQQQQPMMQQHQPMMMNQQQPMMMGQPNSNNRMQNQSSNDPWAGLVDLGNLSLNTNNKPTTSNVNRKSSTSSMGSQGGFHMHTTPQPQANNNTQDDFLF